MNQKKFKVKLWDEYLSRMFITTVAAEDQEGAVVKVESTNKDCYLIEIEEIDD